MTFLFKAILSIYRKSGRQKKKVIRLVLEGVRRLLIWLGDPAYTIDIRGKRLVLPVSHKLPIYIADYPLYDTLPARIADYLRTRDGMLLMVDVGANVGDTILACSKDKDKSSDGFLAVEANPEFVRYLKRNASDLEGFVPVEAFCHSGNEKQTSVRIDSVGGTASITEMPEGLTLPKRTLDEILTQHSKFRNFNFLKLDTDGNDFEVLKGSPKSISASRPIILMECYASGNANYVDDVLHTITSLAKAEYKTVIVYDNLGNYFCTFPADDPAFFLNALAYQIISEFGYYDLLFLSEKDLGFVQKEKEFFRLYVQKSGLSGTLGKALGVSRENANSKSS